MKVWGGRSACRNSAGPEPQRSVSKRSCRRATCFSLVQAGPVVELKVNGSRDIDAGEDDPQLASSYVTDIHQHLLSMEVRRRVRVPCVLDSISLAFSAPSTHSTNIVPLPTTCHFRKTLQSACVRYSLTGTIPAFQPESSRSPPANICLCHFAGSWMYI